MILNVKTKTCGNIHVYADEKTAVSKRFIGERALGPQWIVLKDIKRILGGDIISVSDLWLNEKPLLVVESDKYTQTEIHFTKGTKDEQTP